MICLISFLTLPLFSVFHKAGVNPNEPMVSTCGSGITAAIVAMAAHIAFNKDIPVYDVSITVTYVQLHTVEPLNDKTQISRHPV